MTDITEVSDTIGPPPDYHEDNRGFADTALPTCTTATPSGKHGPLLDPPTVHGSPVYQHDPYGKIPYTNDQNVEEFAMAKTLKTTADDVEKPRRISNCMIASVTFGIIVFVAVAVKTVLLIIQVRS